MQKSPQRTLPDIRKTMLLDAPIERVWQAVATSEGIAAWFMPNDFQPNLGQEFTLHAGRWGDSRCQVTQLDPPTCLEFTWAEEWRVRFELEEVDGKTQFTLVHSGWFAGEKTEFGEEHETVRDRMDQGWGGLVVSLQEYVEAA